MDPRGDSVNLGDDDIVKNTQFSSDDYSGSQVPATVEAPVLSGASKETAAYNHSVYSTFGGPRPPQLQHPQVSYVQQNAWPNYATGYSSAVHPMPYLPGSAMYSPFPSGNFNNMSQSYSGHSQVGPPDSFLLSQMGHVPVVHPNMQWLNVRTRSPHVQEPYVGPPVIVDQERNGEPRPLSTRQAPSSAGPWYCPRSRQMEHEQDEDRTVDERQFASEPVSLSGNLNMRTRNRPAPAQPSELRHSPPAASADTQQGPVRSDSVDVEKTLVASKYRTETLHAATPSQSSGGMQRSIDTPSKSNTPESLMQRKALREDEKTYLKEVKTAIAEGRVPQVTVGQDENGNIVRYKSQFFNALKLAAHAVVQDAYIDVSEKETMNEIMEEVRRQFVLLEPLPAGMVEVYLKGYFKRCRSEYHKFWIKNGDIKKPDGCKQAAWLQLIDYWKSAEGKEECKRNQRNATTERSDVDSLALDSEKPRTNTAVCPTTARNPMVDISNKLHEAVDNILSSFAAGCGSLLSLGVHKEEARMPSEVLGSEGVKRCRGVSRTSAEVLGSLQRPQMGEGKVEVSRSCALSPQIRMRISEKLNSGGKKRSADAGIKEKQGTLETKASMNDSSPKGKSVLKQGEGEVRDDEDYVGVAKEVTLLLSSDGSSDGGECSILPGHTEKKLDDITSLSKGAYIEEIEGWMRQSTKSGSAMKMFGRQRTLELEKSQELRQKQTEYVEQSKQKSIVEEGKSVQRRGKEESRERDTSKTPGLCLREVDGDLNADVDSRSECEMEEADALEEIGDGASEQEEAPVLQREVVKRKLESEYGGSSGNKDVKERGNQRVNKVPVKKQKGSQIDASVLKKLEFFKRPKNSNPIKTRTRVWVLHPKYVGKVVAEANAGVNRKSRCVDSANEICKEGQQMISVVRVLYKNMPVMYDVNTRFPRQISYLDQAEGSPNTPVLWCVSHLIEIPPLDQITRLLGEFIQPLSQETVNSDSEMEGTRRKGEKNLKIKVVKDSRRGRIANAASNGAEVPKVGRTVLRSANV